MMLVQKERYQAILAIIVLTGIIWLVVLTKFFYDYIPETFQQQLSSAIGFAKKVNGTDAIKGEVDPCSKMNVTKSTLCIDGAIVDLSNVDKYQLYDRLFSEIQEPTKRKKTFAKAVTNSTKLTVVLIVMNPGAEPRLQATIRNIAHVHGGKDVAFTIISSPNHKTALQKYLSSDWKNIEIIYIGGPFNIDSYCKMITSLWFWDFFDSDFALITHTDSVIFRPLDDWMYNYDLIGAPWPGPEDPNGHPKVGNGGYTLRRIAKMKQVLLETEVEEHFIEDVWWSAHLTNLPREDMALEFSNENTGPKEGVIPTGAHKIYAFDVFTRLGDAFRLIQKMGKHQIDIEE